MTTPLLDPNLEQLQAADPAAFLEQDQPAPIAPLQPLLTRDDVERDLTVAIIVIAGLVVRDLLKRSPTETEDPYEVAQGSWRKVAPIWARLTVPALHQAYVLGQVSGAPDEIEALAQAYSEHLGDYVNESSAQALSDGVGIQLNQKWSFGLAWRRAANAYGLDQQQMRSYLKVAANPAEDSPDVVPSIARVLMDKLLQKRAERVAQNEAYTAEQTGKALGWLYRYQNGMLPAEAEREWEIGEGEHHCAVCLELAQRAVPPDEPFTMADGSTIWAPRAHPGCTCRVRLRGPAGETIAKANVSVAGLAVLAEDTGRVLMIQRANDGGDPAGGMWEFPGGHLEKGETPLDGARREWEEEVHRKLPLTARPHGSWVHGIYQGFVVTIPSEALVPSHTRGRVINPDDPDGDEIEAIAWWETDHLAKNPAVRPELRQSLRGFKAALPAVSKAQGEDPYDRDTHGRFAAAEGRRSAVALAPDPEVMSLLGRVEGALRTDSEQGLRTDNASRVMQRARGSLRTEGALRTAGQTRTDSGLRTETAQRAEAEPRTKAALRTAAAQQFKLRLTLKMPAVATEATGEDATREGYFVQGADVSQYYDELFDGAIGAFGSRQVHFGDIAEWFQGEGIADRIPAPHKQSAWNGVGFQAEGYDNEEWDELMTHAAPIWAEARAHATTVLPQMDSYELSMIASRAFLGSPSTNDIRQFITRSLAGDPDVGHGIGDAYADYVTFARPDYLADADEDADHWDRYLSTRPEREYMEAEPPQGFRLLSFAKGDDVHDVTSTYDIVEGSYISALAERSRGRDTPNGHLNAMLLTLEPDQIGDR